MPSTPNNLTSVQPMLPPALLRVAWVVALALMPCAQAQRTPQPADPDALIAAFVYNFCLFTDWSTAQSDSENQEFVLAIAGQPLPALAALGRRKVGTRSIQVVQLGDSAAIPEACDALLCSALTKNRQSDLLAQAALRPILTLSPDPGFCQAGGIVEFFVSEQRMRFRVSLPNLHRAKLRIASRLLQLAEILPAPAGGNER